ncbi:sensor histidine kinase [Sphingomonas profundi]|uniref:sensor histidine kinase n=1 Tax=Alterirhizorhabdus profundi TaxID=2681549 RepID=UPI0012E89E7F|nr:HAMP domain-containing sensor histidine kinase [Sphingomonas profundi]
MRLWPASLFGRLLAIGLASTLAALLFAGFAIGHVLERFVLRGMDERLDAQVAVLARAIGPDGRLDERRVVDLPGFDEAGTDWTWQVAGPGGSLRASTPNAAAIAVRAPEPPPPDRSDRHLRQHRPAPGDGYGRRGEPLHARTLSVETAAGPVTITATGPRRIVAAPVREAMMPLLGSLGLIGLGLAGATLLQLRLGLRPLRALRDGLAEVRAGRARAVPGGQPRELAPLVEELNALIAQNEAGLAYARQHVANLAHGLKTPLAALALRLAEGDRDPDGSLGEAVRQIDSRVRHHLGRARAAAPGGGRVHTPLAVATLDLVAVLRRVHADRGIAASVAIAAGLAVAIDPQDLDEMLGNLLDNAWRHARQAIRVEAEARGPVVALTIEDDGPGLDAAAMAEAMLPGRRLDERGDGHGFGLPIARELAELNGGSLRLARSTACGGLLAELILPA